MISNRIILMWMIPYHIKEAKTIYIELCCLYQTSSKIQHFQESYCNNIDLLIIFQNWLVYLSFCMFEQKISWYAIQIVYIN